MISRVKLESGKGPGFPQRPNTLNPFKQRAFFLKGFGAGWQEGCYLNVTTQVTQTYISSTVRA